MFPFDLATPSNCRDMTKYALCLLAFSACRAPGYNWDYEREYPYQHTSRYGVVAGSDEVLCRELAAMLDEVVQQIDAIGLFEPRVFRVQMLDDWPWPDISGLSAQGKYIAVPGGSLPTASILGHEATHCFMFETPWELLGQIVEEGVCDEVGLRVDSINGGEDRYVSVTALGLCLLNRVLRVEAVKAVKSGEEPWTFVFETTRDDALPRFPRLGPALLVGNEDFKRRRTLVRHALGGLGQLVVSRIGLRSLEELCLSAAERGLPRVPVRELIEAAELPRNYGTAWESILSEGLGGDVLVPVIAKLSSEELAPGDVEIELSWH